MPRYRQFTPVRGRRTGRVGFVSHSRPGLYAVSLTRKKKSVRADPEEYVRIPSGRVSAHLRSEIRKGRAHQRASRGSRRRAGRGSRRRAGRGSRRRASMPELLKQQREAMIAGDRGALRRIQAQIEAARAAPAIESWSCQPAIDVWHNDEVSVVRPANAPRMSEGVYNALAPDDPRRNLCCETDAFATGPFEFATGWGGTNPVGVKLNSQSRACANGKEFTKWRQSLKKSTGSTYQLPMFEGAQLERRSLKGARKALNLFQQRYVVGAPQVIHDPGFKYRGRSIGDIPRLHPEMELGTIGSDGVDRGGSSFSLVPIPMADADKSHLGLSIAVGDVATRFLNMQFLPYRTTYIPVLFPQINHDLVVFIDFSLNFQKDKTPQPWITVLHALDVQSIRKLRKKGEKILSKINNKSHVSREALSGMYLLLPEIEQRKSTRGLALTQELKKGDYVPTRENMYYTDYKLLDQYSEWLQATASGAGGRRIQEWGIRLENDFYIQ